MTSAADDDLALVAEARPLVVDLARALSLAAHVDIALVRALRTRLFAEADVSTEADLWSSTLVESRGEGELVLREDIREALWQELRDQPTLLRAHRDALSELRGPASPLLELEEQLTFHALGRDLDAIDRELRTVITAMRDDPDRRRNLAAWSAQALDHLPAEVRDTEAARILGNIARAWVATPQQIAAMTPAVDSMELVQQLQPDAATTTSIYLRRVGDTLEVAGAAAIPRASTGAVDLITGWVEIPRVPAMSPVLIVDHDRPVSLDLRSITRIPVHGPRIMVGTVDKRRWWLEPEPPVPNLSSIFTLTDSAGSPKAAYLVAPDQAVTTARWLSGIVAPPSASSTPGSPGSQVGSQVRQVPFTGRPALLDDTRARDIIALDEDADIALVRLSTPVDDPPLEIDPDVRQGQSWQAFSSGRRTVGTIATAWPGVTLRWPTDVPPPPPGTPIFSGAKVIGHVASDPIRNGLLHTVSARLIRWWLGQVSGTSSAHHGTDATQTAQQAPNASAETPGPNVPAETPGSNVSAETPGSNDFSPSVFSADEPNAPPQSSTATPRVWIHSKRSATVPREMTFQGAAGIQNGDLMVVFVGETDKQRPAAIYRVTGATVAQSEMGAPPISEVRGTRVVDLPPSPNELVSAHQVEISSYAHATSERDTRSLGIHDGLIDLLWRLQSLEEGPPGGVNRERAEARDLLRQLFGAPRGGALPYDPSADDPSAVGKAIATLPVVIELPSSISTGGLLGTVLAHDGDIRRFRRHQWGDHEVTIVVGAPAQLIPDRAIRVKITDVEIDPRSATMEFGARLFRNPGKEPFYDACSSPPPPFATEVIRGPRRGGTPGTYDLELIVNRIPHVAPAHAYRRGVHFVVAVLDAIAHPGEPRVADLLHIPGCGALDLAEAQKRMRTVGFFGPTVSSIDPETDLFECRYASGVNLSYSEIATTLGGEVAAVFRGPPAVTDLLTHRFGVARRRAGRAINVSDGAMARVSVQATNDAPVRGYVAIYFTTSDNRIDIHRVRAERGVAIYEIPRRIHGYSVGAVIEDEGLVLEAFVGARPLGEDNQVRDEDTRPNADANLVFLSCSSRDKSIVREIAKALITAGLGVFFDEASRELGPPWNNDLREQVGRAALFVAFISHATESTSHAFLWTEWSYAVEEQRKLPPNSAFILPVALEPVDPQTAQVPELFRRIQWLPLYQRNSTIELVELITQRVRERQRGAKAT